MLQIKPPISIIGAGIGGMTLGRCLLKKGIRSVLYDRATSSSRYNYGITLHPWAYQPLLKMLDMDETEFKQRVAVDGHVGGFGAINPEKLCGSEDLTSSSFRANRKNLEMLLRDELDIRWENAFEGFLVKPTSVIVRLRNGQSNEHSCVIAADGVHSALRKYELPCVKPTILPFATFNGRKRIDKRTFQDLYLPVMNDSSVIDTVKNDALLQISINEMLGDEVNINWIYSRAAQDSSDLLYKPDRSRAGAVDIPERFYEEIRSLTRLELPFEDVFIEEQLRNKKILSWLMRTVKVDLSELQRLAQDRVFFIGDSIHAQPILGGKGANMAIEDGLELADCIAVKGIEGISNWYKERHQSWMDGVEKSKHIIRQMHM